MWGKKCEKNFFPKTHVYRGKKTMEKNRLEKVRKNFFFYENTNIVTKKWGEKNARKFFPETHVYREL